MRTGAFLIVVCLWTAGTEALSALQSSSRTYESLTDTTFVTLRPFSLADEAGKPTGLTLRVFGSFPGEDEPRDPVVSMGFLSSSRTWQYSSETEKLALTLDNTKRVFIGPLRHEWTTTMDGLVFQQVWAEIRSEVLFSIVRATDIRGQVGRVAFVLNPQQREAMRALARDLSFKE